MLACPAVGYRTDLVIICAYRMFLSRTVAAEICMEAKTNDAAYVALKRLDKEGVLKFGLGYVFCGLRCLSHCL